MKLYEYINAFLRAWGCRQVFGVPGSLIMPVWQNLPDLNLTLCSHEQEASYAASGYAKASGELTAVLTTGSPGVTNCVTGIAGANMDSVPIIYISGKTDRRLQDTGMRQEEGHRNRNFESVDLMEPITKQSIQITDITTAAEQFRLCCETAVTGRAGCVHVCIPLDLQRMELPPQALPERAVPSPAPVPDMPVCGKPLIIMGWGCYMSKAADAVYELARRINSPVLVTSKAYCCIRQEEACYLGKLGYGYNPRLEHFLAEYGATDVLAFGCSMSRKDISPSCAAIVANASVHVFTQERDDVRTRFPSALPHETEDLAGMLRHWLRHMPETEIDPALLRRIALCKAEQEHYFRSVMEKSDTMAMAFDAIGKLGNCITVTADAGNNLLNAAVLCTPNEIGGMFLNDGIRSMGSGICETVGMAMADPNRYYIAAVGDGGMLMNGNVMYLARKLGLPIAFVVMNNRSLGRVRVGQSTMGHFIGSDLGNVDFVLYARAFGLEAFRTEDVNELTLLLSRAAEKKEPILLELLTDKDEVPLKLKLEGVY